MKAESLKQYAAKHGWDLYYSRQTQDWTLEKN